MSDRPVAIYYSILQYQPENLSRLRRDFEVIELATPDDDKQSLLCRAEVLFAPLGYTVDRAKIDAWPVVFDAIATRRGHASIFARSTV